MSVQVSRYIDRDPRDWLLEVAFDGEHQTLLFPTAEDAGREQTKLRRAGAQYLPTGEDGRADPRVERVFTPLHESQFWRLRFSRADVLLLDGDLDTRVCGLKARVQIGDAVYDVYGCPCDLENCNCDAYIVHVS
jgi:hypothetical protein